MTGAKCSRRARRGTSLRRALGAASREQLTPSCASSSLLYRNGAKPRWTCSTRRAAWRSSGALAQQHVAWTMEGSVILLILRARRHRPRHRPRRHNSQPLTRRRCCAVGRPCSVIASSWCCSARAERRGAFPLPRRPGPRPCEPKLRWGGRTTTGRLVRDGIAWVRTVVPLRHTHAGPATGQSATPILMN